MLAPKSDQEKSMLHQMQRNATLDAQADAIQALAEAAIESGVVTDSRFSVMAFGTAARIRSMKVEIPSDASSPDDLAMKAVASSSYRNGWNDCIDAQRAAAEQQAVQTKQVAL